VTRCDNAQEPQTPVGGQSRAIGRSERPSGLSGTRRRLSLGRLFHPVTFGAGAFVLSLLVLGHFAGPTKCSDGWPSPSIGKSGACSHHHDVDDGPASLRFMGSLAIGFGIWFLAAGALLRREGKEATAAEITALPRAGRGGPSRTSEAKDSGPMCPTCGSRMRRYITNSETGDFYWWCSRFPACEGTRAGSVDPPRAGSLDPSPGSPKPTRQ
jgi:hypothetical protein